MESLSDPSYVLKVVAARYTRAYFPLIISSHSQFGHSEPPLSLLNLGVQSHHFFSVWAFKATTSSRFGRSEPPSSQFGHSNPPFFLNLGIQSHPFIMIGHSLPPSILNLGRSEPPSLFSFGVQSHHLLSFGV